MLDKLKKTLGRRKPLETLPAPNVIVPTAPAQANSKASLDPKPELDSKAALRSHFNAVLADPETLEQHYKEMLCSRGTSEFARGQMGQLPDATKRELVRMWLMSSHDAVSKEAENASDATKKRAFPGESTASTSDEDTKRQKTENRRSFVHNIVGKPTSNTSKPEQRGQHPVPRPASTDASATGSSLHDRPSSRTSISSQSSAASRDPVAQKWVDQVKHMHYVITHRTEYDPKNTKDMDFEKMIIQIRLFLRAESIQRLRQFINDGGLSTLVNIVTAILSVDWREQHETRFLLGILHCIRIVLKTQEGADRFSELGQHEVLFPHLVRMQFSWGEERRAFFRFDHRAVITEIFYYWVQNVSNKSSTLETRANTMLKYLQDRPEEAKEGPAFVSAMHKVRRYKDWHKEVKNTTQPWLGTPWMYYHKENVLQPRQQRSSSSSSSGANHALRPFSEEFAPTRRPELISSTVRSHTETLVAHYVAANLDLMNICLVAQPERLTRNALRQEFADCGFEDLFGCKLRLASQANFPCIESALCDWVTAAKADSWPVAHVTALPEESEAGGDEAASDSSSLPACLLKFDVLEDTPFDL